MKKEKLRHYAHTIASHADSPWVAPLFFLLFFADSLLLVLPVDSLLAATMTLRPRHIGKWLAISVVGFGLGLGLLALLVNSHLQPMLFHLFQKWGYMDRVRGVMQHAQDYGYLSLTIGVFTLLPSLFGVLIGGILKLNPWAVWAISLGGKVFKIILTVVLVFSSSQGLKKVLKVYLKTSV